MIKMLYSIELMTPIKSLSGWGFNVKLWPEWQEAVHRYNLDQSNVDLVIDRLGRGWLDACGFDSIFDPDNCGIDKDPKKKHGPNARPFYKPNHDLRVTWGNWGPEHISVPGNACGLDIDVCIGMPMGGKCLTPHNVDCMKQAYLLMMIFSWFGNAILLNEEILNYSTPGET